MWDLIIHNEKIESIFQLLGRKENNISYSVGFTLAYCDQFLINFLKLLNISRSVKPHLIKIKLQKYEKKKGFTDFEIVQDGKFHLIIEAKRGWNFPGKSQITKYSKRPSFIKSNAIDKRIIIINESTPAFAQANFNLTNVNSIPISVISWSNIQNLIPKSKKKAKNNEKNILHQLDHYLNSISTMQKYDSNWVYVVSLGNDKIENSNISYKDVVNKYKKYFHPVGTKGGWPAEPPNYIAFRYDGKLQSIHHIDKYEVFTDPSLYFSQIPKNKWDPHFIYFLGPNMVSKKINAGSKINKARNLRVWAMLDLLLTSRTIERARDISKKRERDNQKN